MHQSVSCVSNTEQPEVEGNTPDNSKKKKKKNHQEEAANPCHSHSCWACFTVAFPSLLLVFSRGTGHGLWAARGAVVTHRTQIVWEQNKKYPCSENIFNFIIIYLIIYFFSLFFFLSKIPCFSYFLVLANNLPCVTWNIFLEKGFSPQY